MELKDWVRLLRENRFRIDRWPTALSCSLTTAAMTLVNPLQRAMFRRKCAATPLVDDPIFVIGHWRSGTTLVQELMTLDDRLVCPNTFQCFAPRCFLLGEWWFKPLTWPLLPRRRPMDNMQMSWNAPMEDEWALMAMGLPTTYRWVAFPNESPRHLDYLNMEGIPVTELKRWQAGLREFALYLNYHFRKQLLFKSPPHTGRIGLLLKMFPKVRFVHITRNPLRFIPSTIHMWAAVNHTQSLQSPDHDNLRGFVFECFERLYRGYDRDRRLLNSRQLVEIRFEDLVSDYVGVMRDVYDRIDLKGFEEHACPHVEARMEESRSYRGNDHQLSADLEGEIYERCGGYIDQFGYSRRAAAA